ncbi:MAG: ATP-binding cassette domain-containing protein [Acidimicrobiia bacterium]|nr:ATP-binding cassette domain-containing protein [Acidimicrobiia bacterium]MCY4458463.1 ATP-binding cassette domain-containing protein [Acidimicrobiaceae bacterium]
MTAIQANGLVRCFGDLRAVDGIDLEVAEGEIYGFLGPNGAGKSTLVRMLCTLLLPTSGSAQVAGFDLVAQANELRFAIGVALQDAALDDRMTGLEILQTQGRLFGLRSTEINQRIQELAPILDMSALKALVSTYSGGMKRRLDLAASLMHSPSVLFLDEPTTGLDPQGRLRVWEEVRRLNRELGMTVFLTTQYLEEADELCNRIGIINNGKLVAEGSPAQLKRSVGIDVVVARLESGHDNASDALAGIDSVQSVERHGDELIIGTSDGSRALSPIALAFGRVDVPVIELALRTPTLDDVFLEITGNRMEEVDL